MIYDDQPQMVDAAERVRYVRETLTLEVVRAAFAAIDREALIRAVGANRQVQRATEQSSYPDVVEAVLVAAGVIPALHETPERS